MEAAPQGISMLGSDPMSQALTGVGIVVLLYLILIAGEFIYNSIMTMWKDRVELFPNTYVSGPKMLTALQNPSNSKSKTIYFSDNQRSGIEFTYAMFLFVKSDTFATGEHKLHHILHKGYSKPYPLMGPGIFCWGDKNILRVYMNCFDNWNNYSDIENIPVDKWFHLTVSCKGNTMYVYINGNLKQRMKFSADTPPYQNFGNVYLFNSRKFSLSKSITTSLEKDIKFQGPRAETTLDFAGSAKAMISRVYYFSYALTYTEIQYLMNMGPSTVMDGNDMSMTPYLSDTWWANKEGP
jgi:hypothetical protein